MPELRKRHGWAWTRLFRRCRGFEAAMAQLEAEHPPAEREHELV